MFVRWHVLNPQGKDSVLGLDVLVSMCRGRGCYLNFKLSQQT